MGLITKDRIPELTELLTNKGINLFHSCQLTDFESYLKLRGIPSRNLVHREEYELTEFDTDENDKENEVWDKVFVNLSDFGNYFALYNMNNKYTASIPTIYGPISIQMIPTGLEKADDICLSLKSAGLKGFKREDYGISIEQVEDIFFCVECENPSDEPYIKRTNELRETFDVKDPGALNPELNFSIENEILGFENIISITVDPIIVNGRELYDVVKVMLHYYEIDTFVLKRKFHYQEGDERKKLMKIISENLSKNELNLTSLKEILKGFEYGLNWINRVENGGLEYNLNRYLNYLKAGTIDKL
ncbi:hypothetical protein pgond44_14543 [Psychroflexus gondwanensis ACAM 44]|uniref:Uncharacterized protein n=1 Tax=Psychroflexus gondwanensis ACAM 44 TaxID=1189619 RepID=N1WS17_9FLAO|nr:hypothetical protein [Psychroflexus gondwanensis]EMY79919.1 hypothetical protein pgond44_14543 [Psychroflexus gondwanensis ACAM 44]